MSDLVDKTKVKSLIDQINRSKAAIAKERDTLRELIDDVEGICEDIDEADVSLEDAVDSLSKLL